MFERIINWLNAEVEIEEDNFATRKKIIWGWTSYLLMLAFLIFATVLFLTKQRYIIGSLMVFPLVAMLFIPFKRREIEARINMFMMRMISKQINKKLKKFK